MDDQKLSEVRVIFRELAQLLQKQAEDILTLRKVVGAIQRTLDNDSDPQGGRSALSKSYRENLGNPISIVFPQPNRAEAQSQEEIRSLSGKLTEW